MITDEQPIHATSRQFNNMAVNWLGRLSPEKKCRIEWKKPLRPQIYRPGNSPGPVEIFIRAKSTRFQDRGITIMVDGWNENLHISTLTLQYGDNGDWNVAYDLLQELEREMQMCKFVSIDFSFPHPAALSSGISIKNSIVKIGHDLVGGDKITQGDENNAGPAINNRDIKTDSDMTEPPFTP